jgi:spoIIIJ-associated protein
VSDSTYSVAQIGPKLGEFLSTIFASAGLDLKFELLPGKSSGPDFERPDTSVVFSGRDVDLLLANRAELLLAVELLAMEALRIPSEHHSRLSFDANDYRLLRIEELRMSAAVAAEKVKRTGVPFYFNPMSSRERRILHLALRNETELRSESAGLGPHRQVVVYPAGMPSRPAPEPPPFRPRGFGSSGNGPRGDRGGSRGGPGGGRDRGRAQRSGRR